MGRFLLAAFSEEGFFFPAVGLGQHLASRGHNVGVVADEGRRALLESLGLVCFGASGSDAACLRVGTWGDQEAIARHSTVLRHAVQHHKPDVLVVSALMMGGLVVGEVTRLPTAAIGFASYMFPRSDPSASGEASALEKMRWWRYSETLRIFQLARDRGGLAALSDDWRSTRLLGDLLLLRTIPDLEDGGFGLPGHVRFVGPCLWEPDSDSETLNEFVNRCRRLDTPIIYAQVGRSFEGAGLWPTIVAAFGQERVAVVASVSRSEAPAGDVPQNFLVERQVRQSLALAHAGAMICDGHSSAVLGALRYGVPSVLVPNGSGTDEIAHRCQQAGVAEILPSLSVTAAGLRAATVAKFRDADMKVACAGVRQKFSNYSGFERAALAVEELQST